MHILLEISFILLASVIATVLSKKAGIPAIVCQLFVGIILGPALLNVVHEGEVIHFLSEVGVILLMFIAGLEAHFDLLKNTSNLAYS